MEGESDRKGSLFKALSTVISSSIRPSMYLEKISSKPSALMKKVYDLLSQDLRIDAFDELTRIDSSVPMKQYIEVVLYAARFLLANKLQNECYLFLVVAQAKIEEGYGLPYDYTLYEEIGNMFYLGKNYQEAIKAYERLLEIGERSPAVLNFNIGVCYQEMANYPGAIQAFLKSINLDGNLVKSIVCLGNCYQTLKQYDKAIGIFQQLPSSAESFTCIGNAYFFMKNYEEAIANYLKAIKLDPNPGTYNNLGAALKKAGLLQDAIFAMNDSLSLESSAETVANLITLYIEVGKTEEAEKLFESSKKVLNANDFKYFSKLISEKQARMKRASVIMSNVAIGLVKNIGTSPNTNSPVKKAANKFMHKGAK